MMGRRGMWFWTAGAIVVLTISQAHAASTITIGVAGPLTGDQGAFGQELKNGALIAVDEWNAKGGVLGRKIEILWGDDQHDPKQAVRAAEEGADYLGIGPIFPTATKFTGYEPVGCDVIRQLRSRIDLPLLAIGGITLTNAGEVIRAGAAGAAVISAIMGSRDVASATQAFLAAILDAERAR